MGDSQWKNEIASWDELDYWRSDDWKRMQEKLDVWDMEGIRYCPDRSDLFAALDCCPYETANCAIIGQDPYPNPIHATGIAFSIPRETPEWYYPSTLKNIFRELKNDLHLPDYFGTFNGELLPWCTQGVLLWNVFPTCLAHRPGSHSGMTEWVSLTREIISRLSSRRKVFVFLGSKAQRFADDCGDWSLSTRLDFSHPSPLGCRAGIHPFIGSRMFSRINQALIEQHEWPIDWNLARGYKHEVSFEVLQEGSLPFHPRAVGQDYEPYTTVYGEGLSKEIVREKEHEGLDTSAVPGNTENHYRRTTPSRILRF